MPKVYRRSGPVKVFPNTAQGKKDARAYAKKNRNKVQSTRLNA